MWTQTTINLNDFVQVGLIINHFIGRRSIFQVLLSRTSGDCLSGKVFIKIMVYGWYVGQQVHHVFLLCSCHSSSCVIKWLLHYISQTPTRPTNTFLFEKINNMKFSFWIKSFLKLKLKGQISLKSKPSYFKPAKFISIRSFPIGNQIF